MNLPWKIIGEGLECGAIFKATIRLWFDSEISQLFFFAFASGIAIQLSTFIFMIEPPFRKYAGLSSLTMMRNTSRVVVGEHRGPAARCR